MVNVPYLFSFCNVWLSHCNQREIRGTFQVRSGIYLSPSPMYMLSTAKFPIRLPNARAFTDRDFPPIRAPISNRRRVFAASARSQIRKSVALSKVSSPFAPSSFVEGAGVRVPMVRSPHPSDGRYSFCAHSRVITNLVLFDVLDLYTDETAQRASHSTRNWRDL